MSVSIRTSPRIFTPIRSSAAASAASQSRIQGEESLKILQIFESQKPKSRLAKEIVYAREFSKKEIQTLTPISSALAALPKPYDESTLERIKTLHPEVALSDIADLASLRQNLINIAARSGVLPRELAQATAEPEEAISIETPEAPLPMPRTGPTASLQKAIFYGLLLPGGVVKSHKELSSLVRLAKTLTKEGLSVFSEEELPIVEAWLATLGVVL